MMKKRLAILAFSTMLLGSSVLSASTQSPVGDRRQLQCMMALSVFQGKLKEKERFAHFFQELLENRSDDLTSLIDTVPQSVAFFYQAPHLLLRNWNWSSKTGRWTYHAEWRGQGEKNDVLEIAVDIPGFATVNAKLYGLSKDERAAHRSNLSNIALFTGSPVHFTDDLKDLGLGSLDASMSGNLNKIQSWSNLLGFAEYFLSAEQKLTEN